MGTPVPYEINSFNCHLAEVTFPPLPQSIAAGTQIRYPGGMQG